MSVVNSRLVLIVCFLSYCTMSVHAKIKWASIVEKISGVNDVISMAMEVADYIDGEDISNEDLLQDIQNSIDAAKTDIVDTILITSKFDKIDTAVIAFRSSLRDLQSYVHADKNSTHQFKDQFIQRFTSNGVIQHIRFLPELLTYAIPGTSGDTLIKLFERNAKCDHAKLTNFKAFYMHLLSDGISLELVYLMFQDLDPEMSLSTFSNQLVIINALFLEMEGPCWDIKTSDKVSEASCDGERICTIISPIVGLSVVALQITCWINNRRKEKKKNGENFCSCS